MHFTVRHRLCPLSLRVWANASQASIDSAALWNQGAAYDPAWVQRTTQKRIHRTECSARGDHNAPVLSVMWNWYFHVLSLIVVYFYSEIWFLAAETYFENDKFWYCIIARRVDRENVANKLNRFFTRMGDKHYPHISEDISGIGSAEITLHWHESALAQNG